MNNKTLNELDGSSMLNEVISEKIEANRKSYKRAIKNAFIRNDQAYESAVKANARAEMTREKLDALVDGGMEGFLANKANDEEYEAVTRPKKIIKQSSSISSGYISGDW